LRVPLSIVLLKEAAMRDPGLLRPQVARYGVIKATQVQRHDAPPIQACHGLSKDHRQGVAISRCKT
jgi:hypothetical protein